jgi:hypothetical protein
MRYEGYSTTQRVDDILDKISKYGMESLREDEIKFLNAHKYGNEQEVHDKMKFVENEVIFEDDWGYFKYEHERTEVCNNETHYIGILYVPDITLSNGNKVEGRLKGEIVVYKDGQISPDFHHDEYDVFEFCNGLEYELDSFLDYVVDELNRNT